MPIDDRVKAYIRQMVDDGINNVAEVRRHTESYVKRDLFAGQSLPSHLHRRYFPNKRDYSNIIRAARVARMHSHVDQEQLQAKMSEWQQLHPDDRFFFRPYVETETVDVSSDVDDNDDDDDDVSLSASCRGRSLLVVYQSHWQRRLLARYGSMCLLDATYKTTRYSLPLFFLCVRTNVDYAVAAVFVAQSENSAIISEALELIRSWNSDWHPSWFMVDFCEAEIQALESVFTGSKCLCLVTARTALTNIVSHFLCTVQTLWFLVFCWLFFISKLMLLLVACK